MPGDAKAASNADVPPTAAPVKDGGGASDTGTKKSKDDSTAHPPWIVLALCLFGTSGILIAYGWLSHDYRALLVLMLIAAAALTVGGILGFMFGIPRTPAAQRMDDSGNGSTRFESPKPSTSLEQVSDWLTKILVGAGLVELNNFGPALQRLGAAVQPTGADPAFATMAQAGTVVFSILGFVTAYLWTRTEYGRIQARADVEINRLFEDRLSDTSREAKDAKAEATEALELAELNQSILRGDVKVASSMNAVASLQSSDSLTAEYPAELKQAVQSFSDWNWADWDADPSDTLFKTSGPNAGRRLTARIVGNYSNSLKIELRVERGEGSRPLDGPIAFLLHPTFRDQRIDVVTPSGNSAVTTILAESWFTVAAIADMGQTVLKASLRDMEGAPRWFTQ